MPNLRLPLIAVATSSTLFGAPAKAAPVYLSCSFTGGNAPYTVDLTLNESERSVTYLNRNSGTTKTLNANFTQTTILFVEQLPMSYSRGESTWEINRVTGEAIRRNVISFGDGSKPIANLNTGMCKKETPTKRVF